MDALNYHKAMQDHFATIVSPLKNCFNINFSHMRYFFDGSLWFISSLPSWTQFYYENELFKDRAHAKILQFGKSTKEFLWSGVEQTTNTFESLHSFNIHHGYSVANVRSEDGWIDIYNFSSSLENENVIHLYNHNQRLLKKFILYFNEQGKDIIDGLERVKFCQTGEKIIFSNTEDFNQKSKIFLNKIKFKNIYVHVNRQKKHLTPKDVECLKYYSKGLSAKEIALRMNLSPRTIEDKISQIKYRLNLHYRSALTQLYYDQVHPFVI